MARKPGMDLTAGPAARQNKPESRPGLGPKPPSADRP
jgi:hypothetical protein